MPEALDARVRHDDVEVREVLERLLEEAGDGGGVGDVGLDGDGVAAERLDLGDDGEGRVGGVRVVDDDGGAARGELEGEDAALATA